MCFCKAFHLTSLTLKDGHFENSFFSPLGHALINLDSILELHMVLTCSDSQTCNWLSDDGKKGRKFQLVCALCDHKFSDRI